MRVAARLVPTWDSRAVEGARATSTAYWGSLFLGLACLAWPVGLAIGYRSALGALTLAGFVGAAVGMRRPSVGLLGMGLLCTIDAPTRLLLFNGGGILRWNTLNYWLLLVLVCFTPLVLRSRDVHTRLAQALL